jgi:hypothetical protein
MEPEDLLPCPQERRTGPKKLVTQSNICYISYHFLTYFPYFEKIQEVMGRTNRLISLIRHGPHRKRNNYVDTHRQTQTAW